MLIWVLIRGIHEVWERRPKAAITPQGVLMKKQRRQSIESGLNFTTRFLMVILLLPAVTSLLILAFYTLTIHRSTEAIYQIAALRPVIEEQIPEQTWSVIAGRNSFEDCGVYDTIRSVDEEMDSYMKRSSSPEILVARRTMDTLKDYVEQIETQMADDSIPVSKSEETLEEVRSVATLTGEMLDSFIYEEIQKVNEQNLVLRGIAIAVLILGSILLTFSFLFARHARYKLVRSIHSAIDRVQQFTREFSSGNLDARASPALMEEMSDLTNDVNVMAEQMGNLIEQNRKEQENLKKAELRTLQAQVNPHFLYNTLDTIVWAAETGKDKEVVVLTKSLSDFFRSSLSSGQDWVTVEQEIRHLNGYLSIQKIRYRDILNYKVEIEDGMENCVMLKLLLQPLVENALYHGIKFRRGGGNILVKGWQENGRLNFMVQDTGIGMTKEQLEEVLSAMESGRIRRRDPNEPEAGGGFGLYNVDQRIRLYYAQEKGLEIESGQSGTTVHFSVPVHQGEEQV